jgi:hypothetical protein
MSQTVINFTHIVDGIPTNATSVKFSDPTATFGLQRKDTLAILIPAGTALTRTGVGQYAYSLDDPDSDLTYRYYLEIVYGSQTSYIERETSIGQAAQLEIATRYCTFAGMRALYGSSNLRKWAAVDGTENQIAIVEAITAAMEQADAYVDGLLMNGPYNIPFTAPIPPIIANCANNLAAVLLHESQGVTDTDPTLEVVGRYSKQRQMAMRTLARIKAGYIDVVNADGSQIDDRATGNYPEAGVDPDYSALGIPIEVPYNVLRFY